MNLEFLCRAQLVAALAFLVPNVGYGADVLRHVPGDAYGFVVAKNAAASNAKAVRIIESLQLNITGPLEIARGALGLGDALDANGDILLAMLPSIGTDQPTFAVWLPTKDYDRLIRGLGGDPTQQICAVTIGGESVLVAHQEDWALVMDSEARLRMQQLLTGNDIQAPPIADWKSWIDSHDITAVALTPGVRTVLLAGLRGAASQRAIRAESGGDDLFGGTPPQEGAADALQPGGGSADGILAIVRKAVQNWARSSRKIFNLALHANAAGLGIRVDDSGNAQVRVRLAFDDTFKVASNVASGKSTRREIPMLDDADDFVVSGTGYLPGAIFVAIASGHVQQQISEMESVEHIRFGEEATARVLHAVEVAAADVDSAAVLTRLGKKEEGVYTNTFLAVRAGSASVFIEHVKEGMRLWNKMNTDAQGETHFVFDIEELKLDGRPASQYSLDLAAMEGGPALPEIRDLYKKFFGLDGKLRLIVAPVGDNTVLLAMATPDQATAAIKALEAKTKPPGSEIVGHAAFQSLPAESDWKVFIDAHRYNEWLRREREATVGVPVIGGPLVKDFPPAPPIGAAGGFREREAWADFVVPAETIKSAGTFLKK